MKGTRVTNLGKFLYAFDNRFNTLDGAANVHDLILFNHKLVYTPFNAHK